MNLEEKIQKLENEIAEIKKEIKKNNENGTWIPKEGEKYYYLTYDGTICSGTWDNYKQENRALEIGSIFRTKEDAKFMIERLRVIQELKQFAKPFKINEYNWTMHYSYGQEKIKTAFSHISKSNDLYFESEEKIWEAIVTVGEDRVKKYYLGVEE